MVKSGVPGRSARPQSVRWKPQRSYSRIACSRQWRYAQERTPDSVHTPGFFHVNHKLPADTPATPGTTAIAPLPVFGNTALQSWSHTP